LKNIFQAAERSPHLRDMLEDRTYTTAEIVKATGHSDRAVRRWRASNIPVEPQGLNTSPSGATTAANAGKGSLTETSTGAEINNVIVTAPVNDDWSSVFALFNMDADKFVVVDDTVKMSTWQQSKANDDGTRTTIQLWSYSARFKKISADAIDPKIVADWRAQLIRDLSPAPVLRHTGNGTYLMLVSDPQLGKKGTEEAVENWKRGVSEHVAAARDLNPEAIHVAFQGDEHEGVVNNYCVSADTPVLTEDLRWVPAGELVAGDALYTVEEERQDRNGRRYAPGVVQRNEVKMLPSVRVDFSDGTSLVCTAEHPVLARKRRSGSWEWVRADQLKVSLMGSTSHEVAKLCDPWVTATDFEAGWLSGLLDGEGCLQRAKNRPAWRLNVSQKPGAVLDKARDVFHAHKFDTRETVSAKTGVVTLHINGGYSEVLRALGTFQPVRLMGKVGHPYVRTMNNVFVVNVWDAGMQPIAVMGTSSHTYIANGIVSHNTNQPHTVELNFTKQLELDYDMRVWTMRECASLGLPMSASSVISNHGEWTRNGGKDVMTTRGDNSSTHIARQVKKQFDALAPFTGVEIDWTIADGDPNVLVNLSGIWASFTHAYIEKGKGDSVETRTKGAIERQILGKTDTLAAVPLYFTSHYHHFYSQEFEGRTQFACPALEAERSSEYMLDQYGVWSPPGMLGMLIGRDKRRGWSNLAIY
jgi:hypothetical protein